MPNRQQIFEAACAAWTPAPEDNPEAVPFYRAHAGLRAAWGEEFYRAYDSAMHRAACEAGYGKTPEESYRVALASVRDMAQRQVAPSEPRYNYCHYSEPRAPTEQDALEFFRREWRKKHPGKRVTCAEATAKYAEVKGRALEILTGQHVIALDEWRDKVARVDSENAKRRAEWQNAVAAQDAFRSAVAALER